MNEHSGKNIILQFYYERHFKCMVLLAEAPLLSKSLCYD